MVTMALVGIGITPGTGVPPGDGRSISLVPAAGNLAVQKAALRDGAVGIHH